MRMEENTLSGKCKCNDTKLTSLNDLAKDFFALLPVVDGTIPPVVFELILTLGNGDSHRLGNSFQQARVLLCQTTLLLSQLGQVNIIPQACL